MSHVDRSGSAAESTAGSSHRRRWPALLLLIPLIGTLIPPFYNRIEPSIGGMPFFYWYQFAWIVVSVTITVIVYLLTDERS